MGLQKENTCELGCIIWLHCFLGLREKGPWTRRRS